MLYKKIKKVGETMLGVKLDYKLLSDEEVRHYIKLAQAGDLEAREKVILSNKGLVFDYVFNKCEEKYKVYEDSDLIQTGMIGLIKAVDSYDVNSKTKFASYAFACIRYEIFNTIHKDKDNKFKIRKIITTFTDYMEEKNKYLKDPMESTDPFTDDNDFVEKIINKEEYKTVLEALNSLKEKYQEIIKHRYGFYGRPMTPREIAQFRNCSRQNIEQLTKKALKRLKDYLEKLEEGKKLTKKRK